VKIFEQPFKQETFKDLFTTLDQHCTINDDEPDSIFLLAYLFFSQGNYQLAVDYFTDSQILKVNSLASWFIEMLAESPYKVLPTNNAATKALYALEKAQKYLKQLHYETAQVEFKRAFNNLTGADNLKALSGLLVCLFQAASQALSVQNRADFYSNCADYLRRYLISIGDNAWKDFKINLQDTFPSKDDYTQAKKILTEHTKERTVDFEAHYFQAFVNYFEKKYLDAYNSFKKYLNTMNRDSNPEVHYFMAACKNP
jgi:tetratricopeptide (TPR) repeat protein